MPPPPAADGPDKGARPARGLHGRLDVPAGAVELGTELLIGGWVVHERLRIDRVLVTVDDEIVGHARVDVARPDVCDRWPDVVGATHRGWSVIVPPVASEEVTVRAYAHVEGGDGDPARLGPWIRFAEATLPVVATGESFGRIDDPGEIRPGVLRVSGAARAPGGLTRVELSTVAGDAAWVRARHTLPYAQPPWATDAEERLAGFAGYVRVPSEGTLTIRAVAVGTDGRRHELTPITAVVVEPDVSTAAPERLTTLLDRFEQRLGRLARPASPARILVATHALDLGGAQLYLLLLLERLRERGLEFCIVSRATGPLQVELETADVPVLVFGTTPSDREVLEGQVLAIAEFAAEHGVVGCLANSLPTFPAVIAAQRLGLPTAWAIHESFDLDVFWTEAYGHLPADVTGVAEEALARCDEVVFEAESTRQLYADRVPADRRILVPYGVDATAIDAYLSDNSQAAARATLGLAPDALVLACVGTVEARKAQLSLVRAFARIPPDRRRGVQLVVVGMNASSYAQSLRLFVADAGIADAIVLVEVTRDIYPWYLAADVLMSASDVESVPRTMLEAMLLGRPVAATAAFGVGELVTDGGTGFLCDPLDLAALQSMLERVMATPRVDLAAMGGAARKHVAATHDPSVYVDHFEARFSTWLRRWAQ
ncbi:glycosyltransferase family 4 protein [Nocardioides cavernae]|uniref:Glycosyltransferase family 4 protein n=1 Tax=Nocardioides cavernae TaxID=1921566 RepID=A0ABR8N6G7_9ACTN|nr:glycosyltransferase family 4 protein [Nocardioides cavernae]MBD3923747.1 glycosyltransferase family 4 protein [Nocardioides cavernae]MBM7511320.1 glycosyltransferase involved in cell wall biosynthesis [Nocardioides cavernae]